MTVTAATVAHLLDWHLLNPAIKESWRPFILDYLAAGFDSDGKRVERSYDLDLRMKTLECEECQHRNEADCPVTDCPVREYRLLRRRSE